LLINKPSMNPIELKHRNYFTNLYLIAISDGVCHASELEFLYNLGEQKGLTTEQIQHIIENPHKARFIKPDTVIEAIEQLYDMGQMVCADGRIHPYEVDLCKSFSRKFELRDDMIDEIVEKLIDEVSSRIKTFNNKESAVIINDILAIIEGKKQLSPIEIDLHHRIFLPGYNLEIKLNPLAKSIYFLFLKHVEEGIYLKKLCEHKAELLSLYCKISSKSENEDIIHTINDLVDIRSNAIHENRSRINQVFLSHLDKNVATNYCIEGARGEAYKINLPGDLIHFKH
jgi:hypothetical protein